MKHKLIICCIFIFIYSCKSDRNSDVRNSVETEPNSSVSNGCPKYIIDNKKNNLNISFLLDLSDRIDTVKYSNETMSYYRRDLGYIDIVYNSFINHIKQKRLILLNDKIQVYFEPLPLDKSINDKSKQLKSVFDKNLTENKLNETEKNYKKLPREIYQLALKDNKYVGSDIWRFFKDKVKRYTIDECSRNILVILTDGYIYHPDSRLTEENMTSFITPETLRESKLNSSKWQTIITENNYGFIPATNELQDLEVLVLGIVNHDKKRNPYGEDVIKKYWKDWLSAMDVKKSEVYGAEIPINLESTIVKFINN